MHHPLAPAAAHAIQYQTVNNLNSHFKVSTTLKGEGLWNLMI
jgi:hypothetical protein